MCSGQGWGATGGHQLCIYLENPKMMVVIDTLVVTYIWSNYSDLTRPHPKWWFSNGIPLISGKSELVKYYNLARYIERVMQFLYLLYTNLCIYIYVGSLSLSLYIYIYTYAAYTYIYIFIHTHNRSLFVRGHDIMKEFLPVYR